MDDYITVWILPDDQDIIDKLRDVDNIGNYIKGLIRADIQGKDEEHAQNQENRTEDPA